MGNQLVAIAPQQIHPVEYYLADYSHELIHQRDENLGSTRFFKVAKVRHRLGQLCVAKIFVIHDVGLPLTTYKERIDSLRGSLAENNNLLPFTRVEVNDKSAILLRPYIKDSLYDRLSIRPFLTSLEKKWITFQIIKALQWIHQRGVCHGDLKLENVLITSSLWVVLCDFATYKPVFLPEDNPADFSYFFDTSRRRACNIAPERFQPGSFDGTDVLSCGPPAIGTIDRKLTPCLTPQMDLFSLGCIIAEIFSEDAPNNNLFDLSQLLAYRQRQYNPKAVIETISDENIREMVRNLVELEPEMRNSTTQHLREATPSIFPQYFNRLFSYVYDLQGQSPDSKILKMWDTVDQLIEEMLPDDKQENDTNTTNSDQDSAACTASNPHELESSEGLLLLLIQITSQMRTLVHLHAKIYALRMCVKLIERRPEVMGPFILDRLLPYLLVVLQDRSSARARSESLQTISNLLKLVTFLPEGDANIFTDYVLPQLIPLANDPSTLVRITLASNISYLATTARHFLGMSAAVGGNFETELDLLQEGFQTMVSTLLTDPELSVRRTLLSSNITSLCAFFGERKTNDVILSHIITYLNEKNDFMIRCSFFENIISIAAYLGPSSEEILKPLLQQGLADPEETVITKTLVTFSALVEMEVLNTKVVYQLLKDAVGLLSHPNIWIRHSLLCLISILSTKLDSAQIHCKVLPLVEKNLRQKIHSLSNLHLLIQTLLSPIPRSVLDLFISSSPENLEGIFAKLEEQKLFRSLARHTHQMQSAPRKETNQSQVATLTLFDRLTKHEGMTVQVEDQLLQMADLIKRINKYSRNTRARNVPEARYSIDDNSYGIINISKPVSDKKIRGHFFTLVDGHQLIAYKSKYGIRSGSSGGFVGSGMDNNVGISSSSTSGGMNEEWQHMYGGGPTVESGSTIGTASVRGGQASDATLDLRLMSEDGFYTATSGMEVVIPIAQEATEVGICPRDKVCPPCRASLHVLTHHKRATFTSSNPVYLSVSHCTARPKGIIVSHLHEHSAAVNRITPIPGSSLFATCSDDGSIKIWDGKRMGDGSAVINRSRQTFTSQSSGVKMIRMDYLEGLESLIAATNTDSIHLLKVDGSRVKPLTILSLPTEKANSLDFVFSKTTKTTRTIGSSSAAIKDYSSSGGIAGVALSESLATHSSPVISDLASLSPSMFAVSTVNSNLFLYDCRTNLTKPEICLNAETHDGLITSIDGNEFCLTVGTATGLIIVYDLRFSLRSRDMRYPQHSGSGRRDRIRRLSFCPDGIFCAIQNNNDVALWDFESGSRRKTLWASSAPALSQGLALASGGGGSHGSGSGSGGAPAASGSNTNSTVLAMQVVNGIGTDSRSTKAIITAGTDMKIRYWDLIVPERSYIISQKCHHLTTGGAALLGQNSAHYEQKYIEGIDVIQEHVTATPNSAVQQHSPAQAAYEQHFVSPAHRDSISDVRLLSYPNSTPLLISASNDGVVKIWK